jgi:hypothetical protein
MDSAMVHIGNCGLALMLSGKAAVWIRDRASSSDACGSPLNDHLFHDAGAFTCESSDATGTRS